MYDEPLIKGMLYELHKEAGTTPPAGGAATAATPSTTPDSGGGSGIGHALGKGLGMAMTAAPMISPIAGNAASGVANHVVHNQISNKVNNFNPLSPSSSSKINSPFAQGYMQGNPHAVADANKQIGDKTYGIGSYDPDHNEVKTNFSNFQGSQFLKDHWGKLLIGLLGAGGLAALSSRNSQPTIVNNYPSSAQPPTPQFY